jgi:ankyrin repeat protein
MSLLLKAAHDGDLAEVQRLIKEGTSVHERDARGRNALIIATRRGNTAVVKWLVKTGEARISDTEGNGMTAMMWVAYNSHFYVVQWLLEEGGAIITDTVVVHGKSRSLWSTSVPNMRAMQWSSHRL